MNIEDICAFVPLSDKLATAGQPTEEEFRELAASGFEVVINLGLLDPRYCLPDEKGLVNRLGLSYYHIPVVFNAPSKENLQEFFRVMDRCRARKVFVHCAANYRVSCFIALYAQARFGWTEQQAMEHIRNLWEPDSVWRQFMSDSIKMVDLAVMIDLVLNVDGC